jgi:hypothetical protein
MSNDSIFTQMNKIIKQGIIKVSMDIEIEGREADIILVGN